jgi:hypothetical protein
MIVLTTSSKKQDVAHRHDLGSNSNIRPPVDFV